MNNPNLFVTSESAVIRKDRIEALDISEDKRTVSIFTYSSVLDHTLQWTEEKDWDAEYEALITEIFGNPQPARYGGGAEQIHKDIMKWHENLDETPGKYSLKTGTPDAR